MNQKWIPVNVQALVKACQRNEPQAQRYLYDTYGPVMLGITRRYVRDADDAEDVMIKAMYKVMTKLNQLENPEMFHGWMKRIVVNEALMFIRKQVKMNTVTMDEAPPPEISPKALEKLQEMDILSLLDDLPDGYRTIFNMYVIEGYKHREIAEKLDISINTSKSQLIMAKKRLRQLIEQKQQSSAG